MRSPLFQFLTVGLTATALAVIPFFSIAPASAAGATGFGNQGTYVVPPHVESVVTFRTIPNSACTIGALGDSTPAHAFSAVSDYLGVARLDIEPLGRGPATLLFNARCGHGNATVATPLVIRVVPGAPALRDTTPPQPYGSGLPVGLRGLNLARVPSDVLMRYGLPPRPDPQRDPRFYAAWLHAVTTGTRVPPATVSLPDSTPTQPFRAVSRDAASGCCTPTTHPFLSGFTLNASAGSPIFNYIQAQWTVPEISTTGSVSEWIGIDGAEIGTFQQRYIACQEACIVVFHRYIWWYDFPANSRLVYSSIPAEAGDHMTATVTVSPAQTSNNWIAYYWIFNLRTGQSTSSPAEIISPTAFSGTQAEFFVDRLGGQFGFGSTPVALANYGTFSMWGSAHLTDGTWPCLSCMVGWQIQMWNNNHSLTNVSSDGQNTMNFYWQNSI